jgi:hypothetical protein
MRAFAVFLVVCCSGCGSSRSEGDAPGDAGTTVPISPCAGKCRYGAECVAVDDLPVCTCYPGYTLSPDIQCEDIDECALGEYSCDPLTRCLNFGGGWQCTECPPGYTGTGETGCQPTFYWDCTQACAHELDCLGADALRGIFAAPPCSESCSGLERVWDAQCLELGHAVASCERELDCEELASFSETHREHPICGFAYTALANSCGVTSAPPGVCETSCEALERCYPDRNAGWCADNCNLSWRLLRDFRGTTCGETHGHLLQCLAGLACGDLTLALEGSTSICPDEQANWIRDCQ